MNKNKPSTGIVFIHGAGVASWIWRDITPRITIPYVLADLPMRDRPKNARKHLTLEDYVDEVYRQAETLETPNVVIVGHSLGGVIGLELAHKLGDRVVGFAAIGAVVPQPGGSFLSAFSPAKRCLLGALLHTVGTQPPKKSIKNGAGGDLQPDEAEWLCQHYDPEALHAFTDKTGSAVPSRIPALYVSTVKDQALPPRMQYGMAARLAPVRLVVYARSGHLPMIAQPQELSAELNDFVGGL